MPSFDAVSALRTTRISLPMFYEETTAFDLAGFPEILWDMTQNVLGATQRPRYTVYHRELSTAHTQYWAIVRIPSVETNGNLPYEVTGRTSPTPEMAIHTAAWEAIARVPHLAPVPDQRAYYYYPSRMALDEQTAFNCPLHETDPTVTNLVSYLFALDDLFDTLEQELHATQVTLALLQIQPPVPTSASLSSPLLGIPVTIHGERSYDDRFHRRVISRSMNTPSTSDAINEVVPSFRPAHLDVEQVD